MVQKIAVVTGNRAIIVGSGGTLYQVFDVTTPSAASYCGGMSPSGVSSVNAVSPIFEGGNAYAYILTDNSSAEFQIVLGGAGGQFTSSSTFESATYDPGYSTTFNRFVANVDVPVASSISAQVAIAPASGGVCPSTSSSFQFVGPNGSLTNRFYASGTGNITLTGAIPLGNYGSSPQYQNPQRCFRYKVWLSTTDQTQSPILYDLNVNYAP